MSIAVIAVVVAVLGFGLFFFVLKRLLRMAIRLAILGGIIFALLAGAVAWWWRSSSNDAPARNQNNAARPARPAR